MAKDPAFLFYPGDWLGGTIGMTFEEKGAYMELLMMQFTRGHMTERMIHQTVGQLWVNLKDKFEKDAEGLWFNGRLDIEKEKRKSYVDSRKNNKNGSNQHTSKPKKTKGHMTSHMEDVNENRNESKDFERGVGKTFKIPQETEEDISLTNTAKFILESFGWSSTRDIPKLSQIRAALVFILEAGQMDWFIRQFHDYFKYKDLSKEKKHNLTSFLGTPAMEYKNGGWNEAVWGDKIIEHNNNGKSTRQQKPDISNLTNLTDQILNNSGINLGGANFKE